MMTAAQAGAGAASGDVSEDTSERAATKSAQPGGHQRPRHLQKTNRPRVGHAFGGRTRDRMSPTPRPELDDHRKTRCSAVGQAVRQREFFETAAPDGEVDAAST